MKGKELRIVFMGTPDFAVAPLSHLVEQGYNIVGVVTVPDRVAGRGQRVTESAVKRYGIKAGLNVMQPESLRDSIFVEEFNALKPELGVVIAFRMLPEMIWSVPKLGTFNLHASLLPQYRGAAPINWAVINGEIKSGVTTFMLDRDIDTGDILFQREVEIGKNESAGELHDRLMEVGVELTRYTIDKIAAGEAVAVRQTVQGVDLKEAPKIFREDCLLDWSKDCQEIHNTIRGLSPYPAAWSRVAMKEEDSSEITIKIYRSKIERIEHNKSVGSVISDGKSYMKVACGGGFIYIEELQMTNKRRMGIADFLRGFRDVGEIVLE